MKSPLSSFFFTTRVACLSQDLFWVKNPSAELNRKWVTDLSKPGLCQAPSLRCTAPIGSNKLQIVMALGWYMMKRKSATMTPIKQEKTWNLFAEWSSGALRKCSVSVAPHGTSGAQNGWRALPPKGRGRWERPRWRADASNTAISISIRQINGCKSFQWCKCPVTLVSHAPELGPLKFGELPSEAPSVGSPVNLISQPLLTTNPWVGSKRQNNWL